MSLTTDPNDPRLGKWDGKPEVEPVPQNEVYLVLSEEERAKGFVRPYRTSYRHVGIAGPRYPVRDLTAEEAERWKGDRDPFVKFEAYPPGAHGSAVGRYWTQRDLDRVMKGCGGVTTMGRALSETYARELGFYGATYCARCGKHFAVGADGEFVWEGTNERVGT